MDDGDAMGLALDEAAAAQAHGDVPVGAVVIVDGQVIARRHNERESTDDPTAHAELLALRDAAKALGRWRLDDATVVVTLEPCRDVRRCHGEHTVARRVFGADDPKMGIVRLALQPRRRSPPEPRIRGRSGRPRRRVRGRAHRLLRRAPLTRAPPT